VYHEVRGSPGDFRYDKRGAAQWPPARIATVIQRLGLTGVVDLLGHLPRAAIRDVLAQTDALPERVAPELGALPDDA